jgi:FixJ family two-component response regulator
MSATEPTVYLVDDDAAVCRSLARLLKAVGYRAQTFGSPDAFLRGYRDEGPACLVLDMHLPGMTGLELQRTLAAAEQSLPIVFITGHGDVPTSVQAMKDGAVDFLPKPFRDEDLLNAVRQALDRSRQQHAMWLELDAFRKRMDGLTQREHQVLVGVVNGNLNKQIAAELGTSEKTIKVHRGRVMEKMQVSSVADLVRAVEKLRAPATGAPKLSS